MKHSNLSFQGQTARLFQQRNNSKRQKTGRQMLLDQKLGWNDAFGSLSVWITVRSVPVTDGHTYRCCWRVEWAPCLPTSCDQMCSTTSGRRILNETKIINRRIDVIIKKEITPHQIVNCVETQCATSWVPSLSAPEHHLPLRLCNRNGCLERVNDTYRKFIIDLLLW